MNPTEQAMQAVVEETFATLAFMFPLDADRTAAAAPGTMARAVVEFSGPFRGALLLSASAEILEPLATNMMGLEDGACPSPEQEHDAFKELLNVICGNLLPAITSPREVFDVHEPRLLAAQDDGEPAIGMKDVGMIDVDLDAWHVRLALRVQNQPTAAITLPGGGQV
jgi:CheY-specific phosphatase CheX